VFVVGSRDGESFRFPDPTHFEVSEGEGLIPGLQPHTTAWDAIGDLEADDDPDLSMKGKWADLLPSIPEGENYLWHTERGGGLRLFGWRRRFWSFLLKLDKNRPSWTLQAQPGPAIGPFHWKNRRLSAKELGRLQTLPEGYQVLGNLAAVQRQLGNAVPSAVGEILARAIRCQLLDEPVDTGSTLLPKPRRPVPEPEAIQPVPRKYHRLVGEHAAHPGTGKGYGARSRGSRKKQEEQLTPPRLPLAVGSA
jgi:DNA (cytosine-5)-methyltransferase 1